MKSVFPPLHKVTLFLLFSSKILIFSCPRLSQLEVDKQTLGVNDNMLSLLEYLHDKRAPQKGSLRVDFKTLWPPPTALLYRKLSRGLLDSNN